jgi:hypothetical protein
VVLLGRSSRVAWNWREDDAVLVQPGGCPRLDACAAEELLGEAQPSAAADDDLLVAARGERSLFAHAAVPHPNDPIGDRGGLGIVTDEDGGRPGRAGQLADELVDGTGVGGVQLSRGLVREEEPRAVCKRSADRDSLLFPARELAGMRRPPVEKADPFEKRVGADEALAPRDAGEGELERDELARVELGGERQ